MVAEGARRRSGLSSRLKSLVGSLAKHSADGDEALQGLNALLSWGLAQPGKRGLNRCSASNVAISDAIE